MSWCYLGSAFRHSYFQSIYMPNVQREEKLENSSRSILTGDRRQELSGRSISAHYPLSQHHFLFSVYTRTAKVWEGVIFFHKAIQKIAWEENPVIKSGHLLNKFGRNCRSFTHQWRQICTHNSVCTSLSAVILFLEPNQFCLTWAIISQSSFVQTSIMCWVQNT